MKKLATLGVAILFLAAGRASADVPPLNEFTVKLSPETSRFLYQVPGLVGGSLGCGPNPLTCEFGLELEMAFSLDAIGLGQASISKIELHGHESVFTPDSSVRNALESSVASILSSPDYVVSRGPGFEQSTLVAEFPMSAPLQFDFAGSRLMSLSGGPDYRPVDGASYTFSYAVPEPSSIGLLLVTAVTAFGAMSIRRK
jgi:hypothetical protein